MGRLILINFLTAMPIAFAVQTSCGLRLLQENDPKLESFGPTPSQSLFYSRDSGGNPKPGQFIVLQDQHGIFPAEVVSVARDGSTYRVRDGQAEFDVPFGSISRTPPDVYLRNPNSNQSPRAGQVAYVQEKEGKVPVWIESIGPNGASVRYLDGSQKHRVLEQQDFSRSPPNNFEIVQRKPIYSPQVSSPRLRSLEDEAKRMGIRQRSSFMNLPESERETHLASVLSETKKIPSKLMRINAQMGVPIDLVKGGVAKHTYARHLQGVLPRGYSSDGLTWGRVPGAGFADGSGGLITIIAADSLYKNHGSINLVIHEHAHSFDTSYARKLGLKERSISQTPQWLEIQKSYNWSNESYLKNYPEEAFVETVAAYYDSPQTRQAWCVRYPRACTFVESVMRD